MSESQFNAAVDAVLQAIEESLEAADTDVEFETVAGILTLEFDDGSKIIVNRQTPNREIWVAARSGGFHFRWVDNQWVDTRGGPPLQTRLQLAIREQGGVEIDIALAR